MSYPGMGSLIREKRSERGLTQQDVCRILSWPDVYKLSEIEQGSKKVDIATLRKLAVALALSREELGLALYFTGVPPSSEEADEWIERLRPLIDEGDAATYLHDFTWRIYYANSKALKLFGLEGYELQRRDNLLELQLNSDSPAYRRFHEAPDWREFLKAEVAGFRDEHSQRINEPWFQEQLAALMRYDEFAEIWTELEKMSSIHLRHIWLKGYDQVRLPRQGALAGEPTRMYRVQSCPVVGDERFRVKLWIPAKVEPCDLIS